MGDGVGSGGKTRRILLLVLLSATLAGLGAAGVAFRAYDKATKIDRSNPELVLDNYLRAALNRRDDSLALVYSCDEQSGLASIRSLREQIEKDEQDHKVTTVVAVVRSRADQGGDAVVANLQISQEGQGVTTRDIQAWRFTMIQDDGWRVCGAERLPDPTPTPSASATQSTAP